MASYPASGEPTWVQSTPSPSETHAIRAAWCREALRVTADCRLIFLDPDNGFCQDSDNESSASVALPATERGLAGGLSALWLRSD